MVGAVGIEPTQTYLNAGDLQSLELTNAQHAHLFIEIIVGNWCGVRESNPSPSGWKPGVQPLTSTPLLFCYLFILTLCCSISN